ncbi:hypothetical protein EVAR_20212_1 [Eumeta japonica]|uniref:Uncharacterized protein n=1 Tax=Eumeta variegata TaxID=151549 RepID=A0A4C1W8H8_EUMVA|nr:hypothetical protein EVAR_20212_1 [Eumeta japonica]
MLKIHIYIIKRLDKSAHALPYCDKDLFRSSPRVVAPRNFGRNSITERSLCACSTSSPALRKFNQTIWGPVDRRKVAHTTPLRALRPLNPLAELPEELIVNYEGECSAHNIARPASASTSIRIRVRWPFAGSPHTNGLKDIGARALAARACGWTPQPSTAIAAHSNGVFF